jgi:hypothetical protein
MALSLYGLEIRNGPFGAASIVVGTACRKVPSGGSARGTLHRVLGRLGQAEACHLQVLDLARQIGSAGHEAHALAGLGRCARAIDRPAEAKRGCRRH